MCHFVQEHNATSAKRALFKKVDLSRSVDKFSEYCMNSLEKGYIWATSFQSILGHRYRFGRSGLSPSNEKTKSRFWRFRKEDEQEVRLYLSGVGGSGAGRRDARKEHEANHWWL